MDEELERSMPPDDPEPAPARRPFFTRRRLLFAVGITAAAAIVISVAATVMYRTGVFDSYVRNQFISKLAEIGITFSAENVHLSVSPLTFELQNATFNNAATGEKIMFIREAKAWAYGPRSTFLEHEPRHTHRHHRHKGRRIVDNI